MGKAGKIGYLGGTKAKDGTGVTCWIFYSNGLALNRGTNSDSTLIE
jgi:hypothetical protein